MKRNMAVVIKNFEGEPLKETSIGADNKPVMREITLASACINALFTNHQSEQGLSGEDKYKRYQLAERIDESVKNKELCELSTDDLALLERLLGLTYTPLVVGPAFKVLRTDPTH